MQIKENCSIFSLFSLKGRILEKKGTSFNFFSYFCIDFVIARLVVMSPNYRWEAFVFNQGENILCSEKDLRKLLIVIIYV